MQGQQQQQQQQHGTGGNSNNANNNNDLNPIALDAGHLHHHNHNAPQSMQQQHDMQRFQQQLQAAQYRQQQQQQFGGNNSTNVGGSTMMGMGGALQQQPQSQQQQQMGMGMNNSANMLSNMMNAQQPGQQLSASMQQSMSGMGNTNVTGNAMVGGGVQQFTGGNNNTFGGNWNNSATTSQQQLMQQHQTYNTPDIYNNFDTAIHGSQRMMSMPGLGVGKTNQYGVPNAAATSSGMSGLMGQHLGDPNVNSVLNNTTNSSAALQNMQMLLLKQQQQQQQQQGVVGNRNSFQQPQNMRSNGLPGIPTTFNSSQQFTKTNTQSSIASNASGIQGGVGLSGTNTSGGTNNQQQQQMLLVQQQIAALKQQQQQMVGIGGIDPMQQQNSMQQLAAATAGTSTSTSFPQQLQNRTNPISLNQQQTSLHQTQPLQARQLSQQMQQHFNRSTGDTSSMGGTGTGALLAGNVPSMQQPCSMMRHSSTTVNANLMQRQNSGMEQMHQLHGTNSGNATNASSLTNSSNFRQSGILGKSNDIAINNQSLFSDTGIDQPQALDGSGRTSASDQASFLGGRFAGGWQSNADLPDRRVVIFSILEVIKQMRPDDSRLSNRLPHMAKSLEEHLYRSAKSKEEYMDVSTLKTRLQAIAHGLEVHRSTDSTANPMMPSDPSSITQTGSHSSVASALRSTAGDFSSLSGFLSQSNNQSGATQPQVHRNSSVSTNQGNMLQNGHQQVNMQQSSSITFTNGAALNPGNILGTSTTKDQGLLSQVQGQSNRSSPTNSYVNSMKSQDDDMFGASGLSSFPDPLAHVVTTQGVGTDSWNQDNGTTASGNALEKNIDYTTSSKFQDPTAAQKMKVILQQQQRLLLLRHASKCPVGPQCTVKFCAQMVTLWKHMKTCRNKNCKTSHCLSSRCVLNHYRICKSNGRTLQCEVCGPVMLKIKQKEREDGVSDDPLTRDQESMPADLRSSVTSGSAGPLPLVSSDQSEIEKVQAVQTKLKAQLDVLKLLQKHQEQLLEQQRGLEAQAQNISDPNSPEFIQLQEQQMLLQQLQKRCQQQQLLIQHEIQTPGENNSNSRINNADPVNESGSISSVEPNPTTSAITQVTQGQHVQQKSIGKRLGKQLGLPPSRKSKTKDVDSRSTSSSVNKRSKVIKQKPVRGDTVKPESEVSSVQKKVEEDHMSQLSCMTTSEIQQHLDSLNKKIVLSSRTVTHKCRPILQELMDDPFGWVFHDAVDPVALGLPDYFDVIKNPMHMDLIRKKLENAIYPDMESFAYDMRLVFQNSILYNGESSEVGELAQSMMSRFETLYGTVVADIENSHLNLESQGELCSLCGLQKRKYEPTVLYCQGQCGMQQIKRNDVYFTDRTKQNHWCEPCFNLLLPEKPILLDDGSEVMKQELQDFKNDALPEEGWVNCDTCHSWVHQVCALFNGRTNKSNARFTCPTCCLRNPLTQEARDKARKVVKGASDLPRCKMSDALEQGLYEALSAAYLARSSELNLSLDSIEKAEGLCVRVLSNVEKKNLVGEKMYQRYKVKGYPREFNLRSKCIALFQKIHGVDTLLFAMYVYEYGDDCAAPNRRHVYISYLDSVRYFEPKCYRTTAYHAVMMEYLRYVKKRGFHTASIWSCPPVNGDDYIFYCHPKHQLVPREDMLRAWYFKMLDQAKTQGIVLSTSTLYDEYFSCELDAQSTDRHMRDPTCLPYFEGDYIPGELEIIIEQCEADGDRASTSTGGDKVMVRLGEHLLKMKDNFIVVHLRNRRFAEAVRRGEDVSNWKEDSDDDMVRGKRAKISSKSSPHLFTEKLKATVADEVAAAQEKSSTPIAMDLVVETVRNNTNPSGELSDINPSTSYLNEPEEKQCGKNGKGAIENESVLSVDKREEAIKDLVSSDATDLKVDEAATNHDALITSSTSPEIATHADSDKNVSENAFDENGGVNSNALTFHDANVQIDAKTEPSAAESLDHVDVIKAIDSKSKVVDDTVLQADVGTDHVDTGTVDTDIYGDESRIPDAGNISTELGRSSDINERNDSIPNDRDIPKDYAVIDQVKNAVGHNLATTDQTSSLVIKEEWLPMQTDNSADSLQEQSREDTVSSRKRSMDEIIPVLESELSRWTNSADFVCDTTDEDPPMESEMFESRQQFLNYCQTAHCQFDDLRRAKHSTIMVLFQLHNPSAPKFLQQCGACYRDITHGIRYHCNVCSNFDLCEDCYEPVVKGTWAKRDPRFAHDKSHIFTSIDMEVSDDNTPKSQSDRQNSLKAHVELLEHAAFCEGAPACTSHNCERFKKIFLHISTCDVKPKRECKICTRLLVLCTMHARLCNTRGSCPVPFCDRIRERNHRLQRQQQLMDDRRRRAQNELYRAGCPS